MKIFAPARQPRYWLHLLLFLLTLGTTTAVGARLARNFESGQPAVYQAEDFAAYRELLSSPQAWVEVWRIR